jgi:hypothetical protein
MNGNKYINNRPTLDFHWFGTWRIYGGYHWGFYLFIYLFGFNLWRTSGKWFFFSCILKKYVQKNNNSFENEKIWKPLFPPN